MLVGNLSGGNQQKLLLAKIMLAEPQIVIIDEPTRGIDVGTKQQFYGFIHGLIDAGHSVIVVSSEMTEVIGPGRPQGDAPRPDCRRGAGGGTKSHRGSRWGWTQETRTGRTKITQRHRAPPARGCASISRCWGRSSR
ncbi:MAG: ATP-binding cassette domain-containing protein [Paracoccaceae bacterium]